MIYFKDVIHPTRPSHGSMIKDNGELHDACWAASSGELAFALIGKVIVEQAWRMDSSLREQLKDLLDRS